MKSSGWRLSFVTVVSIAERLARDVNIPVFVVITALYVNWLMITLHLFCFLLLTTHHSKHEQHRVGFYLRWTGSYFFFIQLGSTYMLIPLPSHGGALEDIRWNHNLHKSLHKSPTRLYKILMLLKSITSFHQFPLLSINMMTAIALISLTLVSWYLVFLCHPRIIRIATFCIASSPGNLPWLTIDRVNAV